MARPFTLAAVAYDAKIVTVWEGFRIFFAKHGLSFDYVLFSNYEAQVAALFAGWVDAAFNSPLAWLQTVEIAKRQNLTTEAIAMRNSDCDLKSLIVARKDAHIQRIVDLQGKKIAVGAKDSPQATLIPLGLLAQDGLIAGKDFHVEYADPQTGKHGELVEGERNAARELAQSKVDAACMSESNYSQFTFEGTLNPLAVHVVGTTEHYDCSNITVLRERKHADTEKFVSLLLAMHSEEHELHALMELEGLKYWMPGRTSHYTLLEAAVNRFGTIKDFVSEVVAKN